MNDIYGYEQMKSPFRHIDSAFDVFYDEQIVVECKDGRKQTLQACVMTDNTGDPLSEELVDSEREDLNIVARRCDWAFVQTLARGDKAIRLCTNKKYVVQEVVEDFVMGLVVKVRQTKCR